VKGAGFRPDQRGLDITEEEGKTRTLENHKGAAPVQWPEIFDRPPQRSVSRLN
jgi:hypothetical protein